MLSRTVCRGLSASAALLEHELDAPALLDRAPPDQARDLLVAEQYAAAGDRVQSGDGSGDCRLAAARLADQGDAGSGVHGEADIGGRDHAATTGRHVLGLEPFHPQRHAPPAVAEALLALEQNRIDLRRLLIAKAAHVVAGLDRLERRDRGGAPVHAEIAARAE